MGELTSAVNNMTPFVNSVNSLLSSIGSKLDLVKPLDDVFRMLDHYANEAERILREYSSWWLRYLIDGLMWVVENAVNLIINPIKPKIAEAFEKLNPLNAINFGSFERILDQIKDPTTQLQKVDNLPLFFERNAAKPITDCVAIVQSGFYRILGGFFEEGANNLKVFESLLGGKNSDGFLLLQQALADMNYQTSGGADDTQYIPENTLGDLLLAMKKESIEGSIAKFDSYLLMNTSNDRHTFKDEFTNDLPIQESHELIHCDPTHDELPGLFEYSRYSWMMASMAALLHHDKITKQAERISILPSDKRVIASFLPEHRGSGKYNVLLYPRHGTNRDILLDSRLPVAKAEFRFDSVGSMATDIVNYANNRIHAEVDEAFPDIISLALVEKVLSSVLNIPMNESVGTAMHLLSGNSSGFCYRKNVDSKEWTKHLANKTQNQSHFDSILLQSTSEPLTESALIDLVKSRTMSKEEVELLDSVVSSLSLSSPKEIDSNDRSIIEEAMECLSMFVVVMENGDAHPVLYTDNTLESNIIYADGAVIKRLLLSEVSEIWEYSVTEGQSPSQVRFVQELSIVDPVAEPFFVKLPIIESPNAEPPIYTGGSFKKGDKFITRYFKRFGNANDNITMTVQQTDPISIIFTDLSGFFIEHSESNALSQLSLGSSVDGFNFDFRPYRLQGKRRTQSLRFVDANTIEIVNTGAKLVRLNSSRSLIATLTGANFALTNKQQKKIDDSHQLRDNILFSNGNGNLSAQASGDILSRLLDFLSNTIRNQNHQTIIKKSVQGCGTFEKKKNHRVIKVGDYVKNSRFSTRPLSTVVRKIQRSVKKPKNRFVKKTTHYLVKYLNSSRTEQWTVKETKKLSDEEKNDMTIYNHYVARRMDDRALTRMSFEDRENIREELQWSEVNPAQTKNNAQYWGLVSTSHISSKLWQFVIISYF